MDIFTTQIAQANKPVSRPVRSEKMKVKKLSKEAGLSKLKKGVHALDDSEYALYKPKVITDTDNENCNQQSQDEVVELSDKARELEQITNSDNSVENNNEKMLPTKPEVETKKVEKSAHLDIFI